MKCRCNETDALNEMTAGPQTDVQAHWADIFDAVMGKMGKSAVPLVLLLLCTVSFQLAHGGVIGCGGFVQVIRLEIYDGGYCWMSIHLGGRSTYISRIFLLRFSETRSCVVVLRKTSKAASGLLFLLPFSSEP